MAVAIFTISILLVMVISLGRHVRLLAATLARFQREVQPVIDEINTQSTIAQERVENLSRRSAELGPGAKIRS